MAWIRNKSEAEPPRPSQPSVAPARADASPATFRETSTMNQQANIGKSLRTPWNVSRADSKSSRSQALMPRATTFLACFWSVSMSEGWGLVEWR